MTTISNVSCIDIQLEHKLQNPSESDNSKYFIDPINQYYICIPRHSDRDQLIGFVHSWEHSQYLDQSNQSLHFKIDNPETCCKGINQARISKDGKWISILFLPYRLLFWTLTGLDSSPLPCSHSVISSSSILMMEWITYDAYFLVNEETIEVFHITNSSITPLHHTFQHSKWCKYCPISRTLITFGRYDMKLIVYKLESKAFHKRYIINLQDISNSLSINVTQTAYCLSKHQIQLVQLYGQSYCLYFCNIDTIFPELNVIRINNSFKLEKICAIKIHDSNYILHIVDNLIVIHYVLKKRSLIFDIMHRDDIIYPMFEGELQIESIYSCRYIDSYHFYDDNTLSIYCLKLSNIKDIVNIMFHKVLQTGQESFDRLHIALVECLGFLLRRSLHGKAGGVFWLRLILSCQYLTLNIWTELFSMIAKTLNQALREIDNQKIRISDQQGKVLNKSTRSPSIQMTISTDSSYISKSDSIVSPTGSIISDSKIDLHDHSYESSFDHTMVTLMKRSLLSNTTSMINIAYCTLSNKLYKGLAHNNSSIESCPSRLNLSTAINQYVHTAIDERDIKIPIVDISTDMDNQLFDCHQWICIEYKQHVLDPDSLMELLIKPADNIISSSYLTLIIIEYIKSFGPFGINDYQWIVEYLVKNEHYDELLFCLVNNIIPDHSSVAIILISCRSRERGPYIELFEQGLSMLINLGEYLVALDCLCSYGEILKAIKLYHILYEHEISIPHYYLFKFFMLGIECNHDRSSIMFVVLRSFDRVWKRMDLSQRSSFSDIIERVKTEFPEFQCKFPNIFVCK